MKKRSAQYLVVSLTSVVATVVVLTAGNLLTGIGNRVRINGNVYSSAEVRELIDEARNDGKNSVMDQVKQYFADGYSTLSVLKMLYPESLVVPSSEGYYFFEINEALAKNDYNIENLYVDENTGRYTYTDDAHGTAKFGIDVSSFQGNIDWQAVRADGVEFAFIRAAYRGYGSGKLVEDEKCRANVDGAHAAGIPVGLYVFTQAVNEAEILEEAQVAISVASEKGIELPIVLDVEKTQDSSGRGNALSVEERTALVRTFCEAVSNAGYTPMIYHNTEMGAVLLDLTQLSEYDKWFAGYNKELYWPYEYKIWQYTDSGSVNGISGNVDLDLWMSE